MNLVWFLMITCGVAAAAARPDVSIDIITQSAFKSAEQAVTFTISLIGLIAFWSGMMRIAERAGLTNALAKVLSPLVRPLFPSIPRDHPALGAILLSMSANMLGLGNAATPLGLQAMDRLQELNRNQKDVASDAMCTYLVITTSSITILPTVVIAMRAAAGSNSPTGIIAPTLVATIFSTAIGLIADRFMRERSRNRS